MSVRIATAKGIAYVENPETGTTAPAPEKKVPRKPRPSELAKKAAKAAGAAAPKTAKVKKPKAAKPKPVKKAAKAAKVKKPSGNNKPKVRTARIDIRATPADRAKVVAMAKRKGMSLTDVVMAGIAKLK